MYILCFLLLLSVVMAVYGLQAYKRCKLLGCNVMRAISDPVFLISKDGEVMKTYNEKIDRYIFHLNPVVHERRANLNQWFSEDSTRHILELIGKVLKTKEEVETVVSVNLEAGGTTQDKVRIFYFNKSSVLLMIKTVSVTNYEFEEIKERNFLMEHILDNLPVATTVKDITNSYKYLIWNRKAESLYNLSRGNIVGENADVLSKEVADSFWRTDMEATRKGTSDSIQHLHLFDGKEHILSMHKKLLYYNGEARWLISSALDITELSEKTRQLEEQTLQHRLLLETINLKFWKWDLRRKEIYLNGNLENGSKCTVIKEEDYFSQILPEYRESILEGLRRIKNRELDYYAGEYRCVSDDGKVHWREGFGAVYKCDENGEPTVVIGATHLIDERKRLEIQLWDAKEKAEKANRVKSAFLASMSHEIRTPLNAIVGFSSILTHIESEDEREEYNKIIQRNNKLLLKLVDDMLDVSKIEAGHIDLCYKWFNISKAIAESVEEWKDKNEVKVRINGPKREWLVELDERRVRQLLDNLLSNAIKYTTKGYIDITYEVNKQELKLSVTDTGCGIPKNKLSTIFDRFEKLNSFAQGTGLGLSICKSIVESMGGIIGVDSEVGVGSKFWVSLPCCSQLIEGY